jgi:hypothetical protein
VKVAAGLNPAGIWLASGKGHRLKSLHNPAISEYVTVSVATSCGNHPTLLHQRADIQL